MRNFRDLKIWQKGMEVIDPVFDILSALPQNINYEIQGNVCYDKAVS